VGECEAEWNHLMEQEFLLKRYGNFSIFEINTMTAEERNWFLTRINKENKKIKDDNDNKHK
jgi:hypothetical protein